MTNRIILIDGKPYREPEQACEHSLDIQQEGDGSNTRAICSKCGAVNPPTGIQKLVEKCVKSHLVLLENEHKIMKTALQKIAHNEMPTDLDEEPYLMASDALSHLKL